ncbi:uncharacterized protein LOC114018255 isoform X1 [Chelonia mydas]|uniref:uncharacterized protein LOC114018255 isoform X1 n=1 Tax=Chelonia mydas TaxID=8469 RepID=UPI001CA93AB8|nr:uncharacterized protein LOC114018255 isoform X1 [Chelonia mydas]
MGTGIPDQEPQTRNQELGNHGTGTMEQEQRLQEQSCSGTQRCQTGTGQYGNRNPRPGATNQELGNHGTGTPEQEQRFQEQAAINTGSSLRDLGNREGSHWKLGKALIQLAPEPINTDSKMIRRVATWLPLKSSQASSKGTTSVIGTTKRSISSGAGPIPIKLVYGILTTCLDYGFC